MFPWRCVAYAPADVWGWSDLFRNKSTLLQFVVAELFRNHKQALQLDEELANVEDAARGSMDDVEGSCGRLCERCCVARC